MKVGGVHHRTIEPAEDGRAVAVIDQTRLPWAFAWKRLEGVDDAAAAIRDMVVRGAPLIGATAAYGMALAARASADDTLLERAGERLRNARPTAVNLAWAVDRVLGVLEPFDASERPAAAWREARAIADADAALNKAIGEAGLGVLRRAYEGKADDGPVNVLTHCNAGWLATVDWGTALAPVYMAHEAGLPVHVWVDETRPRNQGASLTAWELANHGVPHTVVADNAGGHLMQQGRVDLCLVGTDRVAANGDVANKIGTYLKALAARANGVPFHVALPGPTFDPALPDGGHIPIEERDGAEVHSITGADADGTARTVRLVPEGSPVANPGFDVTPAHLVSGFITENGVGAASAAGLAALFDDAAAAS